MSNTEYACGDAWPEKLNKMSQSFAVGVWNKLSNNEHNDMSSTAQVIHRRRENHIDNLLTGEKWDYWVGKSFLKHMQRSTGKIMQE